MKKIISLFISVLIAVSFMSFTLTAKAATNCFSITITGTQYNSVAKTVANEINEARSASGMNEISFSAELEEFAQQRAAEMMLGGTMKHTDEEYYELCSDGTSMSFIFPDYGKTVFTACNNNYTDFISSLSVLHKAGSENIKSIGIAVFKYSGKESYYAIFSEADVATPFSDFTNTEYKKTLSVHYKYVSYFKLSSTAVPKKYYKLYVKGYFTGFLSDYLSIPNSQLIYKSTNSKILKIKDAKGFVKGTGNYTIKLYDSNSVALCKFDNLSAKINQKAPNTEVLSKKKNQVYVRWQTYNDSTGYQIQYSTKKNMKGAKTITVKGAKKKSRTIKKLKSKKKYYIRVRVYQYQGYGEKVYTKWSKVKGIKVK